MRASAARDTRINEALVDVSKALAESMDSAALARWIRANSALLADAVEASGRIGSHDLARLILRGPP